MATKVKLLFKKLPGKRLSLYLDIYPAIINKKTGRLSRRQFLNEIIQAPVSFKKKKTSKGIEVLPVYPPEHKIRILNTIKIAEEKGRVLENQLNKPEIYNALELEQLRKIETGQKNFVDYFKTLAEKRTGLNHDNWIAASKYLDRFAAGSLRFTDINAEVSNDFKDFLLTTKSNKSEKTKLSNNSAASYFNKYRSALRQAYSDGFLTTDVNSKLKSIKEMETNRAFLTIEEINKLINTECNNLLLKRAAIFSALTGLRFSDIQKLTWKEVNYNEEMGPHIIFRQKKTGSHEVLPISDQAYKLLGDTGSDLEARVFDGLTYSAYSNKHLYQWIGAAGITKEITFHSMRHSFATLQLSKGTNIYEISKLLGHKSINTTQIYAKVMYKAKREAVNRIILDL